MTKIQKRVLDCFQQGEKAGEVRGRTEIVRRTGLSAGAVVNTLKSLREQGLIQKRSPGYNKLIPKEFEHGDEVDDLPTLDSLLERRRSEYGLIEGVESSRKLERVRIAIDGPVGILHMGDPHVDDPGTDINLLEQHMRLISETEGLFGANVGDAQNNWVGRLSHLYGQQTTTQKEAWMLVEWLVSSVQWLYLIGGNHDAWSGDSDPMRWIAKQAGAQYREWGARLNLVFPNKREVRINARHDFKGHSQWNAAHGPSKAIQMGWRDHILTCGHKHSSGYNGPLKCPASGLLSHAIRVASYKIYDDYAKQGGFMDENVSPAVVTIINPDLPETHPGMIQVFHDVELAADFLTYLRNR